MINIYTISEKEAEKEQMVSCMRCGLEDYETILRKVMAGDESAYICDNCWDKETK